MSKLEVDKIDPQSGTNLELGTSGDTVTIPTGVTLDASNSTLTVPDSSISVSQLSATGTKDSTTFLRGDNTFQVVTTDLVNDTTPQLGGNLDVNGNSIVSASNGNITLTPDGTGKVIIDGLSQPVADGTSGQFIKTDGAGNLSFDTVDLTNLSASNLTSGTLPDARFPSVLPAVSGANLTNLPGGGKVLQVVTATDSTTRSTSSTSFTAAGNTLSVTITPSSVSSKILILINNGNFTTNRSFVYTVFRNGTGGTNLAGAAGSEGFYSGERSGGEAWAAMYLDSPSTTSATTYQMFTKERTSIGGGTTTFNITRSGDGANMNSITAMEIDGS